MPTEDRPRAVTRKNLNGREEMVKNVTGQRKSSAKKMPQKSDSGYSALRAKFDGMKGLLVVVVTFAVLAILQLILSVSRSGLEQGTLMKDGFDFKEVSQQTEPGKKLQAIMSITDIREALQEGKWSCSSIILNFLDRIEMGDKHLLSMVEMRRREDILRDARKWDTKVKKMKHYPLFCVPAIIKDNVAVKGTTNAAGSVALENLLQLSTRDAPVVTNLKQSGVVVLGKSNMEEFALGFRTLSSRGGQTKNYYDRTRFPGGSSGGTAVALAAGFSVIGVGTDTGGSVRIPASFAGLVGIRPTVGVVSTEAVVPLSHSRDTVGVMAFNVRDLAAAFGAATGQGNHFVEECAIIESVPAKQKLGVIKFLFPESGGLKKYFDDVLTKIASKFELVEITEEDTLFTLFEELHKQKSTSSYEFQSDLEEYLQKEEGLSKVKLQDIVQTLETSCSRISELECGLIIKSISQKMRKNGKLSKKEVDTYDSLINKFPPLLQKAVNTIMSKSGGLEALIYPTFKKLPSKISKGKQDYCGNNRLAPALLWPALSLPTGYHTVRSSTLPQGLEILGPSNSECKLFTIAAALEELFSFRRKS